MKSLYCSIILFFIYFIQFSHNFRLLVGTCIQKRTLSLRSKQKITKDSEIILPNTLILDPIIKKPRAKKVKIEVPKIDQYLELKKEIKQKKSPKEENDSDLYTCLPSPHNLTSNSIIFTVIGPPKPLSRHRTGRGILYNPSSKYQKQFLKACKDYLPSKPFEGPLEAKVNFFFERPKNHYGKGNVLKNDQQYVMKRPGKLPF